MSSHCGQCGARSTIWTPTCVFCGNPVSSSSIPAVRPALRLGGESPGEPPAPCTERRETAPRGRWVELLRLFWTRLRQRVAV